MSNNKEIRKINNNLSQIRSSLAINRAVSPQLAALEGDLTQKLLSLYSVMRQFGTGMPVDYFKNNAAIRYQVYSHIRKKVQDGYLIGNDTVGNQFKKRVESFELFISGTDVNEIKQITQEMFDGYWKRTERLLTRETATVETDNVKLEKRKFDIESAYQSLASRAVHAGYNKAIDSKLANAIPTKGQEERATGLTGAFSFKKVFKGAFEKIKTKITDAFGKLVGLDDLQDLNPREMFLTKEDDKVDPKICEPLNRRVFEFNDPMKPELPMHDWCRCKLIPVFEGEASFEGTL